MPAFGRPALVIACLAFGAAVAACGGGTPTAAPTTVPVTTTAPVSSTPAATAAAETKVTVSAKEYEFTPSTINIAAGPVQFVVTNTGNDEHEFEIFKGETVVDEIEGLVPGLTKELPVTLEPGEYTFVCKLSGHEQLGMKGTLTVTGG